MIVQHFTFNPFQTNCYVCHDDGEAVIVDASGMTAAEHQIIDGYLEEHGLAVRHLLLTHGHIDHIFGCAHLSARYEQRFKMHRDDLPLLTHGREQAAMFGVELDPVPPPDTFLVEGDVVEFGKRSWKVFATPGHSPGSITFYDEADHTAFVGDVLFQGSIGRTDLWEGSLPQLMQSIFQKLIPLGEETVVYSGHGPRTTIATELEANPFLTGR